MKFAPYPSVFRFDHVNHCNRLNMAKVKEDAAVGTLMVKLPTFWPDKPEAWFVQAEANFRARRITSQKTQFNLVVVALDADTIDGVLGLLENPPDEESCDQLKAWLVQSFKISKVDKIKRALEFPRLGGRGPGQGRVQDHGLDARGKLGGHRENHFPAEAARWGQEDHVGGTASLVDRDEGQGKRVMAHG